LIKKAATIFAAFHISQSQKKGCTPRRFFRALIRVVFTRWFVCTHNLLNFWSVSYCEIFLQIVRRTTLTILSRGNRPGDTTFFSPNQKMKSGENSCRFFDVDLMRTP
jgi:hypothetical protein